MRASIVLACVLAVAACKRPPAGERTCAQVGARFYAIAHAQVDQSQELTKGERAGVISMLAPMRDSMVRACTDDHWAALARACFTDAADQAAFYACEGQLSPEQRALLAKHAAGASK
ncbi:MAG: hypothetical protein IPL61_20340 [Myxococcales bacterium]|nr:hypothetical protein [Myxococcales bacterium]